MGILEKVNCQSLMVEKKFKHKAVLFIPSESYCAATITIIQGLEELGFTIYTLKQNINSWWCNKVIEHPGDHKYDFVLWNMHWGTRWGFYAKYNLHDHFNVLIDGCDNRGRHTWKDKYNFYCKKYKGRIRPQEPILSRDVQPYRWMEPLGKYKPSIVFTSQKNPGDKETIYLPFGIHREYLKFREGRMGKQRRIAFTNIPGPGDKRKELTEYLKRSKIVGKVHNASVRSTTEFPRSIRKAAMADKNIHSYHRWGCDWAYFRLLNDTKILLYPGVYARPHWDSKRPWEGLASGCLVLTEKPPIDMSEYPMTELCPTAVYKSLGEMVDKCRFFHHNPGQTEQYRLRATENALRYFTPVPLARHFLWRILKV